MGKLRELTAETLFWAALGFKVLAALKKRKDENAAKVGALKKNATFAANHKTQTAMKEQEKAKRAEKIGQSAIAKPQPHIGKNGRICYDYMEIVKYYDKRFAEVFGDRYNRRFDD